MHRLALRGFSFIIVTLLYQQFSNFFGHKPWKFMPLPTCQVTCNSQIVVASEFIDEVQAMYLWATFSPWNEWGL
jgi:hypothetical protein